MRVLYISGMYPTPAYPQKGIFCHEQVKALRQIGVDVDVVVPLPFYNREVRQDTWTYEGIEIRYVRFFKLPGAADYHRTGKALFRALDRAADLNSYDIYHADAPLPAGQAAMIAGRKYRKPFVVHGHGLDVFLEESYKGRRNCHRIVDASAEVYKRANAVCGVSQKVIDNIESKVHLGDRGHVVYNGVDTDKFYPDKNKTGNYILTAGNLIELKGHDDTITAFSGYLKESKNDSLRLVIAGRGELEDELKKLADSLGIADRVDFAGFVRYEDLRDLMQGARLFCLPSWNEALGCVYLEAMACGIPVIGCRGNGIDEIIVNGINGFLVDRKRPDQIKEIIYKVMSGGNWGTEGLETVREGFTWHHSAISLERVYSEAICDPACDS